MLLLALMWGLSIPVTKLGLETVPPILYTTLRFVVAVPLFFLISWRQLYLPRQAFGKVILLGVMGTTLGNVAQSFGVQGTSASVGTIISATIPIFVVVFAAIRLRQHVVFKHWLGLFAAFGGIAVIALGSDSGDTDAGSNTLQGVFFVLLSAVSIGFYYIWCAELSEQYGTLPVTTWNVFAGFIALLPMTAWEMNSQAYTITTQTIWTVIYLGALVTVLGLILWLYLLRVVPARIAASVQYLQPVVGVSASALLFGDQLGLAFMIGVGCILFGLLLASSSAKRTIETTAPS